MNSLKKFKAGAFDLSFIDNQNAGKPVCLVIGSALFYSRSFNEKFEESYRMIYLDHRGFGSVTGEISADDYRLKVILQDIENFRLANNLGKICIMGHSAHGYMALSYAHKFQNWVSSVCIVAMGPSHGIHMSDAEELWKETAAPGRKRSFEMDMAKLENEMRVKMPNQFVLFCKAMRAKSWVDFDKDISHLWEGVEAFMPALDYLYGEVFRDIRVEELIKDLDKPVLMVLGKMDYQVAPHWTWNSLKGMFKQLTFRVFENSSHNPQVEESSLFFSEFQSWFSMYGLNEIE
ncbi:alpha/beta fold hydrolase [Bdellovibrio bacteriovorus]|nr:alpha/beta fold hydrolase [Bdellovibrio bacteriovorus]